LGIVGAGNSGQRGLAHCQGFLTLAEDGPLGEVESPLFPPGTDEPAYLVLRTEDPDGQVRHPVIRAGLVEEIDQERGLLFVRGTVKELAHLLPPIDIGGNT
jgi:hypothetical protein